MVQTEQVALKDLPYFELMIDYVEATIQDMLFHPVRSADIVPIVLGDTPGFQNNAMVALENMYRTNYYLSEVGLRYDNAGVEELFDYIFKNADMRITWKGDTDSRLAYLLLVDFNRQSKKRFGRELSQYGVLDFKMNFKGYSTTPTFAGVVEEYMLLSEEYVSGSRYAIDYSFNTKEDIEKFQNYARQLTNRQ